MFQNTNIEDYVINNKGSIKLNGVEIVELKECKVKSTPNTITLNVMNCSSELERKKNYKNEVTFKINKVFSRFKKRALEDAKQLKETVFDFEGWVENDNGQQEYYRISDCVLKGDISWLDLNAEGNFAEEEYAFTFLLENMDMDSEISDGEDW